MGNALDYLPRRADHDCPQGLRSLLEWRDIKVVNRDLVAWVGKCHGMYPNLGNWVDEKIGGALTFYRSPWAHYKRVKGTNMHERQNKEIKRWTRVVCIFTSETSCLRLVRAACANTHGPLLEDSRYLKITLLAEQTKEQLRRIA